MSHVLYNRGGFVAHVAVKIQKEDSFDALAFAANLAHAGEGLVLALYDDTTPSRTRVLGVERAGVILEPGTFAQRDEADSEIDHDRSVLRAVRRELDSERARIKSGKGADALDRLILLVGGDPE